MIGVERVDFVSFLTRDISKARQFYSDYSEVLGLEVEDGNSLMLLRRFDV
jgi:catechol 2,3-dioxygenase-like lactoylglutathione lyase family enzyme